MVNRKAIEILELNVVRCLNPEFIELSIIDGYDVHPFQVNVPQHI